MTHVAVRRETRPRIGFSTNIWDNPGNIAEHLEFLAEHFTELEFEIAEEAQEVLFGATESEYRTIVADVRSVIARRGVDLSVHAAWWGQHTDLCAKNPDERRMSIEYLRRAIVFASGVGAERVTYHPGYHARRSNDELAEILCDSLRKLEPLYRSAGVKLCVENMGAERPRYVVFSPEEHAQICSVTGTFVTLDVPHLATVHLPRNDFDEALTTLAPFIQTLHIADIQDFEHSHLPIGEGNFDLWGSLEKLGALGVDAPAIVEEFAEGYEPQDYLDAALKFRTEWDAAR